MVGLLRGSPVGGSGSRGPAWVSARLHRPEEEARGRRGQETRGRDAGKTAGRAVIR